MTKKFYFLMIILIVGLGFLSYRLTYGFFTDTETSSGNTFTASTDFPTPSPTTNIVINEVYYRIAREHRIGSEAGSEWVELFNPTSGPISLNGWSINDNTSCDNIPGSPSIAAGGFAILSTHTEAEFEAVWTSVPASVIYIVSPSAIGNGLANNDELALRNGACPSGGSIVDQISWGSNTNGLNPSIPSVPSAGISSERSPDGLDTNSNTDFVQSSPPTPGL